MGMRGFNTFDSNLIEYLKMVNKSGANYIVSPLSLKSAIALAIAGSNGETKSQLIKTLGFRSEKGVQQWYKWFMSIMDYISEYRYSDCDLAMANGVWSNLSFGRREFKPAFVRKMSSTYHAVVRESYSDGITADVNSWVSEVTHGRINGISNSLSGRALVLINALYLKSSWIKPFSVYKTHRGTFTTLNGSGVAKEFMSNTSDMYFYRDKSDNSKVLVMPMAGGVYTAFVLGDTSNILKKCSKAEYRRVHVELPKFSFESSFSDMILIQFLSRMGATDAFSFKADFSEMCSNLYYIDDIIQKTRIEVDESGLEAAAATSMELQSYGGGFTQTVEEFIANVPFSFYIYTKDEDDKTEMLFYGEVNN